MRKLASNKKQRIINYELLHPSLNLLGDIKSEYEGNHQSEAAMRIAKVKVE